MRKNHNKVSTEPDSSSDAWVFQAIATSPEAEGRLWELILRADAINKLIVSREELEHALRRLMAAGLVAVDGDRFTLTPAGKTLDRKTESGSTFEQWERLTRELERLPPVDGTPEFSIAPESFEAALHKYRDWFRRRA